MSPENTVQYEASAEDLIALTKVTPTIDVPVPIYLSDGKTRKTDDDGRFVEFIFNLHRPTTATGLAFGKFQRGKTKGKKMTLPAQQEQAIRAMRICLPQFASNQDDEILAVIVQTGGYLGENAKLVNACMRLLGQNFDDQDEDDEPDKWAGAGDLPTSSSS